MIIARRFARAEEGHLPRLREIISVESIDEVVFGGDQNYVVRCGANHQIRNVQRLGIDFALNREETKLAEGLMS